MFTPQDVRVDEHLADLGALVEPGAPVLAVGATQRVVTVALRTSQAALAPVGATASLTLPDGTSTDGTVTATAVVTVDEQPQLQVTITPTDRARRRAGWRARPSRSVSTRPSRPTCSWCR